MNPLELARLLTTAEVARALGVAAHTLAVWRSDGRHDLPYVKVGRAVRYRATDVLAYLDAQTRMNPSSS